MIKITLVFVTVTFYIENSDGDMTHMEINCTLSLI